MSLLFQFIIGNGNMWPGSQHLSSLNKIVIASPSHDETPIISEVKHLRLVTFPPVFPLMRGYFPLVVLSVDVDRPSGHLPDTMLVEARVNGPVVKMILFPT